MRKIDRVASVLLLLMLVLAVAGCAAPPAAPATGGETSGATTPRPGQGFDHQAGGEPVVGVGGQRSGGQFCWKSNWAIPSKWSTSASAQWPALATGDLHASLEVWPSGHADNYAEYITNQGVVVDGGLLGPVGKIGWYIPSYLLDEHPEYATWEGLATPDAAVAFATAETGDKGQFLTGDPSWTSYEDQMIENLGLDFQIVAPVRKRRSWLRWTRPSVARSRCSSTSGRPIPSMRNTI
ncbi:MAG: glycine betaine ABC transporter substrate-binding protein [Caldilineaceae bacterium]